MTKQKKYGLEKNKFSLWLENTFFSLTILLFCIAPSITHAQNGTGPLSVCPISTEIPIRPLVTETLNENDIFITADTVEYFEAISAHVNGNAELSYNDQQVSADRIDFDEQLNTLLLSGQVNYWDNEVYLSGPEASIDMNNDTGEFSEVRYWLFGNRGRGNANQVLVNLGIRTEGQRVDYTTCDPDLDSPWNLTTNIWKLSAGKLVLNHERERGSGTNVILKIKNIPVFYMPYISFPISDSRKSGLLVPTFTSSSRYGLEIEVPYYWNIAPQMDATITPRLISNSGVMMIGEYRYLFRRGRGTLNLEYLPNDSVFDGKDRNSISFQHSQSFLDYGRLSLNYNRVSDQEYLEDFSNSIIGTSTQFLRQFAVASYSWYSNGHRLNVYNLIGNYQIVDRNIPISSRPYKRLPSSTITYTSPYKNRQLYYKVTGKFDYFDRGSNAALDNINGMRYDLFPSVSYPINDLSYYLIPKAGVRYTSYQLDQNTILPENKPDRFVPIFSMDSGLFFERNTDLLGEAIMQTLEPRLYYLYIPERDQSDLPVFDTGQFNESFSSLFVENRFNGVDRLGDANRVSLALTSRLYSNESGRQLGSFSLGQAIYLDDRNVVLPGIPAQNQTFSAIIASFESNFFNNLDLSGEYQWDPDLERTQKLTFNAQYHPESGKVLNLGYRKHRADPNSAVNLFKVDQTDISVKWPVNPQWNVIGKWNFAVEESRTLDLFGGVEYSGCCWGIRAVARRFLSNLDGEYETGFFIQIELKGLAGLGGKTVDFLRMSIPGYEEEF